MPNMQLPRLADMNLNYKIQEIMENNGFSSGTYKVYDGYPNESDLKTSNVWPTIVVELKTIFGRNVELGSDQWPGIQVIISVLGRTDSMRDDVAYLLWKALNEVSFTLYDFNTGTPASLGNYAGVTSIGDWEIGSLTISNLEPLSDTNIIGERHNAMLDGILYLPNIN